MPSITVREIAERIRRSGEDLTSVVDRLRNWTDEDLLTLAGTKNPGTGHKRLYSENALIEALVLSALKDAVGMKALTNPAFAKLFRSARRDLKGAIESAKKGPGERFLIMSASTDGSEFGTSWAQGLPHYLVSSEHEAHVVIDLWKIYQRISSS